MTIEQAFERLPLSEKTIIRHRFVLGNLVLRNNLGHPCLYSIFDKGENKELGIIQYYQGRKLCLREKGRLNHEK